jgi:hypothetical protein
MQLSYTAANTDTDATEIFTADEQDSFPGSAAHKKRKTYNFKSSELSWIWSHFEKLENKTLAFCCLCHKEVFYSKCYSTGMLIHHVNVHHKAVSSQHLKSVADTVPRLELDSKRQGTVNPSLILSISLRPAL